MSSSRSATHEKTLFAGNPLWAHSAYAPARALTESIKADVAIIGAGISGAFTAHALAGRFGKVVVIDRRAPGHGSTMASTAMLQFEIDKPLTQLAEQIGAAKAARAWKRSWRATQRLAQLVRDEKISCGLRRKDSLYLAGDTLGFRGLEKEAKARGRIGLPGEYLPAKRLRELFGIDRTGAILSPGSSSANPVQLVAGLLRAAVRNGARVLSPVEIVNVNATAHGVMLDTGRHFIEAKHCVFCTGYELLKGIPDKGMSITSSWAVATRPRAPYPRWLDNTLVWEAADPYLYMRTTPDGRLLVGGEDADVDLASYRVQSLPHKARRLVAKAQALVPDLTLKPAYKWTGAFGESNDGLPVIDRVPGMPNCIAVLGFGGNGTIFSKIASEIVPTLLRGRPDKDADLYRFR